MAANGNASKEDAGPLSGLQVIVGLFAGLAAVIYLTGGAALGLRLMWSGLPALPVGQLPREFLFSLGAAQVVVPALGIGLVAGVLELGQNLKRLRDGHQPWSHVKQIPRLRRTFIAFYGAIPVAVIAPGVAIAVHNDTDVGDETAALVAVIGYAAVALAVWIGFLRASRLGKSRRLRGGKAHDLRWLAWSAILVPGLVFSVGLGCWMNHETGSPRYFGVAGAWLAALFFALLTVWIRSQAGNQTRRRVDPFGDDVDVPPWVVVISWIGTALLVVPGLIAITAAWPLSDAVVCSEQVDNKPYVATGKFVGDTKDRVYIGDDENRRLIAVPAGKVSRVIVGPDAADSTACARTTDADSTSN